MIGVLASALAALAAGSAVVAVATRSGGWVLATVAPVRPRRIAVDLLSTIGSAPFLRRLAPSDRTARRLEVSGSSWGQRDVVGAQVLSAFAAAVVATAVGLLVLAVPLAVLAWRIPGIALERRARRRRRHADREVPVLLDLLAVATSAGLPPQLALRRAVDVAEGPLAEELRSVLRATDLGGRWRDELAGASRGLGLPDLDRTVAALTRSEALGSSLAEEIRRLAADVREARRAAATERARAAPVKMLFPLVFLVLPAFLLLTVVPVLVATVESIR